MRIFDLWTHKVFLLFGQFWHALLKCLIGQLVKALLRIWQIVGDLDDDLKESGENVGKNFRVIYYGGIETVYNDQIYSWHDIRNIIHTFFMNFDPSLLEW